MLNNPRKKIITITMIPTMIPMISPIELLPSSFWGGLAVGGELAVGNITFYFNTLCICIIAS